VVQTIPPFCLCPAGFGSINVPRGVLSNAAPTLFSGCLTAGRKENGNPRAHIIEISSELNKFGDFKQLKSLVIN
jgi:hypothetical protein